MKERIDDCDLELLSAWLDGDCDDPAGLRARLNAEPELALRLRQLQAVRARLATLAAPDLSADFAAKVTKRAFARKFTLPGRGFWWCALPVAAAATLLVMASLGHQAPRQERSAPDGDAWRMALNAAANAPDAESFAEWVDEEPAMEGTLPNDLAGTFAELSTREPGGADEIETDGLDANASVIDMINRLTDEDAAVLAAKLRPGA